MSLRPGSGVSARLGSGTKEKGGRRDLQIRVSTRPYHLLQGPKPDLVIGKTLGLKDRDLGKVKGDRAHQRHPLLAGFNSGFGLKDTWLSSLPRLQVTNLTYPTPSRLSLKALSTSPQLLYRRGQYFFSILVPSWAISVRVGGTWDGI